MQTILFTNPTTHIVRLDALDLDPVPPGGDVEISIQLAAPYRKDNGTRGPSAIEQVAPQLFPKRKEDLEIWSKVPPRGKPVSKIVSVARRVAQEAPGVRALREAAQNAPVSPQTKANATPATK